MTVKDGFMFGIGLIFAKELYDFGCDLCEKIGKRIAKKNDLNVNNQNECESRDCVFGEPKMKIGF